MSPPNPLPPEQGNALRQGCARITSPVRTLPAGSRIERIFCLWHGMIGQLAQYSVQFKTAL